jgi:translation initiation factor 6
MAGNENFFSVLDNEVGQHIPVIHIAISGTRIVGRVTAGNKNGLIVPAITTDIEL